VSARTAGCRSVFRTRRSANGAQQDRFIGDGDSSPGSARISRGPDSTRASDSSHGNSVRARFHYVTALVPGTAGAMVLVSTHRFVPFRLMQSVRTNISVPPVEAKRLPNKALPNAPEPSADRILDLFLPCGGTSGQTVSCISDAGCFRSFISVSVDWSVNWCIEAKYHASGSRAM